MGTLILHPSCVLSLLQELIPKSAMHCVLGRGQKKAKAFITAYAGKIRSLAFGRIFATLSHTLVMFSMHPFPLALLS